MDIVIWVAGVAVFSFFARHYLNLRRTAELFYAEKKQRDAIFNSLDDGVIEYNDKAAVILMNPKAEELLEVKFDEVRNVIITPEIAKEMPRFRGLVELVYPALASYASAAKELPGTSAKTMEVHLSAPERKLLVTLNSVVDEKGNVRGFLKILHDISREQLISRIKSEFVSIAAHQLRTPLSAIKWTFGLLLDGDAGALNQEQRDFITKGYEANERMIKLVSDLLSAARIEEGRFGYEFKEINLEVFLEASFNNSLAFAKSRSVDLKFEKKASGLPRVYADAEKLNLVVNNLLDNAIKYTRAGGRVSLELSREGDFVVVSVADTGVGIPQAEQKRVFSKFFRASNVLRMETEGTGLGLFIVYNIVKGHGGTVRFHSEEGRGTNISFTLPLKKALVPAGASAESPAIGEFLETI